MGFKGISIGSIALILGIVILLFGTKRLRTIGEDIGTALRGLRKGLRESQDDDKPDNA